MKTAFKTIDEYILLFPEEVQEKMDQMRAAIHSEETDITEYIGYQMPAFKYKDKPLIYFAGYKKHIGFYPGAEGIKNFEKDFIAACYKFSKGAVQFPVTEKLPLELIKKMVRFRILEIEKKS
ncbi:iron chaperone [Chryseobacterium populi]|uniref:YdhG-like domain-containing protein n=1 Tax=Chryseobacterium populi TaxID=1144316 RepID=J3CG89_9FLAO|nr:DUF1801 domain-containing protein [Chryseobacterium populi]EJL70796.1 hypothetical protein PMI13_02658 [Chryseobacterium populi]